MLILTAKFQQVGCGVRNYYKNTNVHKNKSEISMKLGKISMKLKRLPLVRGSLTYRR